MKRSSLAILIVIGILAASVVYFRISGQPELSEEEQIHTFLGRAQTAVESKNVRAIMSCVSPDYSDSTGFTRTSLRLQVMDAMRTRGNYDVMLEDTSIRIYGDTAVVDTKASVALILPESGREQVFHSSISLTLRKEETKRWLVIPAEDWKIIRIDGLPTDFY